MGLRGKKCVVLVEQQYQELEVWVPFMRLKEEGAQVLLAAPEKKEYKGKHGYPIVPDIAVKDLRANDFDCVVIPGGFAPDYLRRHAEVIAFARDVFKRGGLVAAICHGLWIPASAGILRGRRCTCFFAIKDDVINAGAKYRDEECVVDGNLISSRTPEDLPAFCREIIKALSKH